MATTQVTPAPTPTPEAPKKSRIWLWVLIIIGVLLLLGGIATGLIVFFVYKAGTSVVNDINSAYNYNTNTSTTDEAWLADAQLVSDYTLGYSFYMPADWTFDTEDTWETGFSNDYVFIYYDEEFGKTTNHFIFRRDDYTADRPDITLGEYSSDFVADLNEGIEAGDFGIVSTSNRTFGSLDYNGYVVVLGNGDTGERNFYVMTVINGVAYEFAAFYFEDQEEKALADLEKVLETVVLY
ncbi:MAG: hypothetical protein AAB558_00400 [Patescibacteria group bacterium]